MFANMLAHVLQGMGFWKSLQPVYGTRLSHLYALRTGFHKLYGFFPIGKRAVNVYQVIGQLIIALGKQVRKNMEVMKAIKYKGFIGCK